MKMLINKMEGLNSSQASLQLDPGETAGLQNLRTRPFYNWAKRRGIDFVSAQTDPVLGIFEIELDNITIPIIASGGTLQFFPPVGDQGGTVPPPDPYPLPNPIDPVNAVLFLVEPAMRTINDRRATAGHAVTSWPNIFFNSQGKLLNGGTGNPVATYPADNIYKYDLAYYDAHFGLPFGTRASTLVNTIRSSCIETVGFGDWVNLIENQSSIVYYDASIFPSASTFGNYRSTLSNVRTGIQKLTTLSKQATQTVQEEKSGTAHDTGSCVVGLVTITTNLSALVGNTLCHPMQLDCFSGTNLCNFVWDQTLTCRDIGGGHVSFDVPTDPSFNSSTLLNGYIFISSSSPLSYSLGAWNLNIGTISDPSGGCTNVDQLLWASSGGAGNPTTVNDPRGTYTRTGGLIGSPSTITIV